MRFYSNIELANIAREYGAIDARCVASIISMTVNRDGVDPLEVLATVRRNLPSYFYEGRKR